jgi:hypothetical protein
MIIILFTPGNFGSTLEYCLRTFSQELKKVDFGLLSNGSMHGYQKECHPTSFAAWHHFYNCNKEIITPVFPNFDYLLPRDTLELYRQHINTEDRVILIHSTSIDQAQRTQLFAIHKIGQDDFLDGAMKDKANSWNPGYNHWQDMQKIELREALSFHVDEQSKNVNLGYYMPENWFKITPDDLLYDLPTILPKLLDYCDLTWNHLDCDPFYQDWYDKQQYILREFSLISRIASSVKTGLDFQWSPLSLYGEAILQSRLRQRGYELNMQNLDELPTALSGIENVLF